jgi:hypothetical protein
LPERLEEWIDWMEEGDHRAEQGIDRVEQGMDRVARIATAQVAEFTTVE